MDDARFDLFTRTLGTRRTTLAGLLGIAAGLIGLDGEADARKEHDKSDKKKKRKHDSSHDAEQPKRQVDVRADGKKKKKRKKKKRGTTSPPPGDPGNVGDLPKDCAAGMIRCNGSCVNPLTNAQNCNGCGNFCGINVACVNGRCVRSCPSSQIRCGDLCVDATSNEDHCGGCGQACSGDLTCLNGTCGCADAGLVACGNECVDLQFADDHCGQCGNACGANQECENGQCVNAHCGDNEIECPDGRCILDHEHACCGYLDCGGFNGELVCNSTLNRCVCNSPDEGICQRFSNGAGLCDVCCGDGSHICIDDTVCVDGTSPGSRFCDCPAGKTRCWGSQNAHRCQGPQVGREDDHRCGIDCRDCTLLGPTSFCCNGTCMTACAPNTFCSLTMCDNCQACGVGQACCRSGSSNLFGCTLLDEFGRCPGPPA